MRVVLSTVHAWPEVRRGAERYVHELAAGLARAGHHPRVLSTRTAATTPVRDEVLGVPVHRLPARRIRPSRHDDLAVQVGFGWSVLPRVLVARADVWHASSTTDASAAVAAARLRPGLTTVFTDHGFPARASRERRSDRHHHARVVAGVDAYVCVSPAAGDVLRRDFGREPVVVPPGVRLADHRPGPRATRPTLLYVGDLDEPRKHVRELLAGAVVLARAVPDLQVWLHGPGDVHAVVDGVDGAADLVTATGLLDPDELAARYAVAWVTALVAEAESFGMVVVESLASGTPAVVLAGSGGPEGIVTPATGVVAADLRSATLAAAVGEALELAADPTTAATCRDVAAQWDWDAAVVPMMLEVYREAAR